MKISKIIALVVVGSTLALAGCHEIDSGTARETERTQQNQQQASVVVGYPAITHFTEKKNLKWLYELRDDANLKTYTYTRDIFGRYHNVCPTPESASIGFGVPFSAQYTAGEYYSEYTQGGPVILPQAEPNGLFMPDSTSATWVICVGKDGKPLVAYEEDNISVSMFPRKSMQDDYLPLPIADSADAIKLLRESLGDHEDVAKSFPGSH